MKAIFLKNMPKTLTDTSPKKICRWQINTYEDVPYHVSREMKIKTMSYPKHLLE
jgi:hypothetical protein